MTIQSLQLHWEGETSGAIVPPVNLLLLPDVAGTQLGTVSLWDMSAHLPAPDSLPICTCFTARTGVMGAGPRAGKPLRGAPHCSFQPALYYGGGKRKLIKNLLLKKGNKIPSESNPQSE